MIIKFKGVKKTELGSKQALEIVGLKVPDGEPWSKKIFIDQKNEDGIALATLLEDLGIGDMVNIVMKQNPKNKRFWNVVDVKAATEDDVAKTTERATDKSYKATTSKATTGGTKSAGYEWKGRTAEAYDRSAAIYLAFDFLKYNRGFETKKADQKISDAELYRMADDVYKYIHDGVQPFDAGVEALDPPEV